MHGESRMTIVKSEMFGYLRLCLSPCLPETCLTIYALLYLMARFRLVCLVAFVAALAALSALSGGVMRKALLAKSCNWLVYYIAVGVKDNFAKYAPNGSSYFFPTCLPLFIYLSCRELRITTVAMTWNIAD
ncbi:hypothetical protein F4802DRAFT_375261 [Xylaria palmicola]|nr:hypothetical protein F4802DRAFT_375261 [Xylaria palmicola]